MPSPQWRNETWRTRLGYLTAVTVVCLSASACDTLSGMSEVLARGAVMTATGVDPQTGMTQKELDDRANDMCTPIYKNNPLQYWASKGYDVEFPCFLRHEWHGTSLLITNKECAARQGNDFWIDSEATSNAVRAGTKQILHGDGLTPAVNATVEEEYIGARIAPGTPVHVFTCPSGYIDVDRRKAYCLRFDGDELEKFRRLYCN